nr:MAG TPA: hypothetical protein [Caudoviricetes sp.]
MWYAGFSCIIKPLIDILINPNRKGHAMKHARCNGKKTGCKATGTRKG